MSFIRTIKSGKKIYYAEVENERINGKVVQRHIRYIGKDLDSPQKRFELEKQELNYLLEQISNDSLTPDGLFSILEKCGKPITRGKLKKFGIEYDITKKTYYIYLQYR